MAKDAQEDLTDRSRTINDEDVNGHQSLLRLSTTSLIGRNGVARGEIAEGDAKAENGLLLLFGFRATGGDGDLDPCGSNQFGHADGGSGGTWLFGICGVDAVHLAQHSQT